MTVITARDWPLAMRGLYRLGRNNADLPAVMDIIQGLEGKSIWRAFRRMQRSPTGRAQVIGQEELSALLMDRAWLATFPPGSLGAAYLEFIRNRPFNSNTMAAYLAAGPNGATIRKTGAVPWFARRIADLHDIAHVLTGYEADARGEGCLMGFTFAQLGAWGYAAIALGSALIFGPLPVLEGYWTGRRAEWLFDLDIRSALAEPLTDLRARLRIRLPRQYPARSFA